MSMIRYLRHILKGPRWAKVLITVVLIVVLCFMVVGYFENKYQAVILENQQIAYRVANQLDFYLRGRLMALNMLANDPEVVSLNPVDMQPELDKATNLFDFSNIAVFDLQCNLITDAKRVHPPKGISDDSFNLAKMGDMTISNRLIPGNAANPRIGLRVPIYARHPDKIKAVLTAVVPFEQIVRLMERENLSDNRYVFIIDSNAQIIYHPQFKEVFLQESRLVPDLVKFFNDDMGSVIDISPLDGIRKLFVYVPLDKTNWRIVLVMPYNDMWRAIIKNSLNGILTFFLVSSCLALLYRVVYQNKRHNKIMESLKLERLSSVNQLAAGIAHEIRNPLTSIKGFIQLIFQKKDKPVPDVYLEIVLEEILRIEKLICEFQKLAKPIKPPSFNKIDVNGTVNDVVVLMESQAINSNIELTLEKTHPLLEVYGDEAQLKQVWINVLRNAIDAAGQGGKIKVVITPNAKSVIITFEDNGPGIPSNLIPKLGTPFFTTKDNGTGLGLSVCYNLIQNHGGNIRIESTIGEGTKIIIMLPLA